MKHIEKFLFLFLIVFYSCDDPYENTTYQVYDVHPASTYLESRSDEFSEWISILKYADLFNAINQATEVFTVFVPDNKAVQDFYKKKGVASIKELGFDYARNLAQYHIIGDSIALEQFIVGGKLESKTLSEDYLTVAFGEGGLNALYVNDEARVTERALRVSNGFVYVMDAVLSPLVETAFERITGNSEPCSIMEEAMKVTGWKDSLMVIADTIKLELGAKRIYKRSYTVLGVTDATYAKDGIGSFDALKSLLNADNDYTNPNNALNRYVAYHILEGTYYMQDLNSFEAGTSKKLWSTKAPNEMVQTSLEADKKFYVNFEETGLQLVAPTDVVAKNGIVHFVDHYMPVWQPQPATVLFDVCDYPEVRSYIQTNGTTGQTYQMHATAEYRTMVKDLSCYNVTISASGPGAALGTYGYVDYFTAKSAGSNWINAKYHDMLILNIGYMGSISMKTPAIIKGKYKVTLQYGYATSQNFIRTMIDGSNGGQMKFSFDGEHAITISPYTTIPSSALNVYQYVAYEELEFTTTTSHDFKIVVMDPAASTNGSYRLYFDYLLFEPIID